MTTKQKAQFSLEDCSCMEMMSQSKDQQGVGDVCTEMMSQFIDPQGSGNEFLEKMSEMMASCCNIQQEEDETIRKA
jgi:hypothetical protein